MKEGESVEDCTIAYQKHVCQPFVFGQMDTVCLQFESLAQFHACVSELETLGGRQSPTL
jgi:hypothetical protein